MWDQTESLSGNEDSNDQENLLLTRNSSKSRPNQVKTYWNDECGENGSTKENLFQKPIICSCCRKRNEQCNVGDTLDIVPSKEHNEITQKNEFSKLEQVERYGTFCARKLIIACLIQKDIGNRKARIMEKHIAIVSRKWNLNWIPVLDYMHTHLERYPEINYNGFTNICS